MGSFNTTCHISNLPIGYHDKAKLFFIVESSTSDNVLCYPWDKYKFCSFGIDAEYDDYGRFTYDEEDLNYLNFIKYINSSGIYVHKDENQYHDIEVDPKNITYNMLWDALHERQLKVKSWRGESCIHIFPILKEVYEKLINAEYESWSGAKLNLQSYINTYVKKMKKIEQEVKNNKDTNSLAFSIYNNILDRIEEYEGVYILDLLMNEHKDYIIRQISEMRLITNCLDTNNKMIYPVMTSGQELKYKENYEFYKMMGEVALTKYEEYEKLCGE